MLLLLLLLFCPVHCMEQAKLLCEAFPPGSQITTAADQQHKRGSHVQQQQQQGGPRNSAAKITLGSIFADETAAATAKPGAHSEGAHEIALLHLKYKLSISSAQCSYSNVLCIHALLAGIDAMLTATSEPHCHDHTWRYRCVQLNSLQHVALTL